MRFVVFYLSSCRQSIFRLKAVEMTTGILKNGMFANCSYSLFQENVELSLFLFHNLEMFQNFTLLLLKKMGKWPEG